VGLSTKEKKKKNKAEDRKKGTSLTKGHNGKADHPYKIRWDPARKGKPMVLKTETGGGRKKRGGEIQSQVSKNQTEGAMHERKGAGVKRAHVRRTLPFRGTKGERGSP